ncbi:hypothetical protein TMatcc_006502 [Talaromyces marneffei ATCC 18224]|uniref:uncharacterized protein n=1 Tax=Talaromyces marneffei TaxID=37727 RepID=UPI0012A9609C|nr:uncharacterized protein EYB26_002561 [Talaromyces marneffei]QGA14905.1 hypothetical protein EYB26_002561 [Talaromyces marneffei]
MPSYSSTVLGLMTALSLAVPQVLAMSTNSSSHVWDVISKLETDPDGYLHIADDGVARAYDANDSVTGYVALSNDQLMELLANLPAQWQYELDHLYSVFDGVDGRDVNQTQLLNPPASLRRDRGPTKSQNEKRAVEPLLERPQLECKDITCFTPSACTYNGCTSCTFIDGVGEPYSPGRCF